MLETAISWMVSSPVIPYLMVGSLALFGILLLARVIAYAVKPVFAK